MQPWQVTTGTLVLFWNRIICYYNWPNLNHSFCRYAGNFEDEHSSDCSTEEDDNFTRSKKATKTQEKIEPNVDYKRQAEAMRELYGERADEIYSMEAKLQYEFDRFCSKERPVLWPCLPINMKFD